MEADGSRLPAPYPRCGTLGPGHLLASLRLRGFHPLWRAIPGRFGSAGRGGRPAPITPHSPMVSHGGSVWAAPRSVALTRGIPFWFLFLALLGCFRSGGSHSQALVPGAPPAARAARRQEIPLGNPRINACLRLPGAYRSLPRPSSAPEPSYPPAGVLWPMGVLGSPGWRHIHAPVWARSLKERDALLPASGSHPSGWGPS